jgi:predicted amidohydrolase
MSVRVTVVQFAPRIGAIEGNTDRVAAALRDGLVIFPECALTGYAFDCRADAMRAARTIPGPETDRIAATCRKLGAWAIVGTLERSEGRLFNSAAIVGPEGTIGVYRKTHRPHLGADRFAEPGDLGLPVFDLPFARIGVLICYDLSFPEAARVLKLRGAQLLCVPTNWPQEAQVSCLHGPVVRAQENHIFVATADRTGEEGGFRFRGESRICDCDGRVLAMAGRDEAVIEALVEPQQADRNRVVNRPGVYELDRIAHRRPDLYGPIVEPAR